MAARVGFAEVVVSDLAWFGKVFSLCGFIFLRTALGLSFYAAPGYAFAWLCKLKRCPAKLGRSVLTVQFGRRSERLLLPPA